MLLSTLVEWRTRDLRLKFLFLFRAIFVKKLNDSKKCPLSIIKKLIYCWSQILTNFKENFDAKMPSFKIRWSLGSDEEDRSLGIFILDIKFLKHFIS